MRLWLARVFVGLAFSLLLAHNLFAHHHDGHEALATSAHHHDEDADHHPGLFDNVDVDGDYIHKLGLENFTPLVPVELVQFIYQFEPSEVILEPNYNTTFPQCPPKKPPIPSFALRGPPIYC